MFGKLFYTLLVFAALLGLVVADEAAKGVLLDLTVSVPTAEGEVKVVPLQLKEGDNPFQVAKDFGETNGLNEAGVQHVAKFILAKSGDLVKRVLLTTSVAIERENGETENINIEVFEGATPESVALEVGKSKGLDLNATKVLARHIAQKLAEKTLLKVKINMGQNPDGTPKSDDIIIMDGADPKRVVAQFAAKHQFTSEAQKKVEEHVIQKLKEAILERKVIAKKALEEAPVPLRVNVDLGEGKSDIMFVNRGEDPHRVAMAFGIKHSLEAETVSNIETHLRAKLKEAGQMAAARAATGN